MDKVVEDLFIEALKKSGIQYLFTLLRVGGIETYTKDPLIIFKNKVLSRKIDRSFVEDSSEFWSLITNLSRVTGDYPYNAYVFWAAESKNYLEESKKLVRKDLATFLGTLFSTDQQQITQDQKDFIEKVFLRYEKSLRSFKNQYPFIKLPVFEVLELLTDSRKLIGFKIHFSNGSQAEYKRLKGRTDAINVIIEHNGSINFMEGMKDKKKPEWRVGDKPLYEIGIPGRYNATDEWMPIIYPGESSHLQQKAYDAIEEDRIQGVLFYIYTTCHWAIEFAAKMAVKLPEEYTKLPGDVHMHRVKKEGDHDFSNEYVYDGTYFLNDISIDSIKKGLDLIQRAMEGIAFTYDNPVKWQVKYMIKSHQRGAAAPSKKDMPLLRKIITATQELNDITVDTSISWYRLGHLTDNKLNAFLCFHIAIEGLAVKLANGELAASKFFGLETENKEAQNARMKAIFDEYYKNYYSTNLRKLIEGAYNDGLKSITANMKRAFVAVFGEKNPVVDEYFKGDKSLNSLRGQLAHGEYSDWHYDQYFEVWKKLSDIEEIAKSFITRVVLQIKPGTKRPTWQRTHSMSVGMDSPKGALVASRLDIFPTKDWKIKAEWID